VGYIPTRDISPDSSDDFLLDSAPIRGFISEDILLNQDNFIEEYMRIQRPLRAYLFAATGNLHETDDLHQAVWQCLWKKLDQYNPDRSFKSWAFGVARMEVLKWRQRHARSRELFSEETVAKLADTATQEAEELTARHTFLIECVNRLDERPRRALEMRYVRRMRSGKIATVLKRSAAAIDMLLSRTRQVLRECVERKVAEAG
jgi:RNA polymerase sigma-70 factor, ECF subfamily